MLSLSHSCVPSLWLSAAAVALATGIANNVAYGTETASATIVLAATSMVSGQTQYTYDLSLSNTSTDGSTVGTFWFAWIPHQSYLASSTIGVSAPIGFAGDYYRRGFSSARAVHASVRSDALMLRQSGRERAVCF